MKKSNLKYYLAASIAFVTFIIYLPTLRNDFIDWDDDVYVFDNPYIRSFDLALIRWAFSDYYASNWHPLTWISHALDYYFWGLNPLGHHLTSVILHAVNTFIVVFLIIRVFQVVRGLTKQNEQSPYLQDQNMLIAAGMTGLLFGIHPLRVESVAWIAERKDLLSALFFMLGINTYAKYAQTLLLAPPVANFSLEDDSVQAPHHAVPGHSGLTRLPSRKFNKYYFFSLGFFILALLSKPMAVSLPAVLLILDWYPFKRIRSLKTFRAAFIEKLPFIALSVGSSILTIFAQKEGGGLNNPMAHAELSARVLVGVKALIIYLWNMIWPLDLIPFYPYPRDASFLSPEYLAAITLVSFITITCIIMAKKQKLLLAIWGYYVISLIPVLGIVQVGLQSMADRYTYLPCLGPFLIVGLTIAWFSNKVNNLTRWNTVIRIGISSCTVLIVFSLAYLTINQIGVWRNSIVLWSYVIKKEPLKVPFAYYNRGTAFGKMGVYDKAIEDYNMTIKLSPLLSPAYTNLGVIYVHLNMYDKALEFFNKSINIYPKDATPYLNRGICNVLIRQYDKALEDFNMAIALNPNLAYAYLNRGKILLTADNKELALADFRKACNLKNEEGCTAMGALMSGNTK